MYGVKGDESKREVIKRGAGKSIYWYTLFGAVVLSQKVPGICECSPQSPESMNAASKNESHSDWRTKKGLIRHYSTDRNVNRGRDFIGKGEGATRGMPVESLESSSENAVESLESSEVRSEPNTSNNSTFCVINKLYTPLYMSYYYKNNVDDLLGIGSYRVIQGGNPLDCV
eukprot:scaffold5667_cov92-Cylindrotheca_fusiformis.AAC.2